LADFNQSIATKVDLRNTPKSKSEKYVVNQLIKFDSKIKQSRGG
jgi:hypothetical protein